MRKITLDAGHFGNYNPSPCVSGYYESHMTWKLHLMLKEELEKRGFIVELTRDKQEVDLEVTRRGKKAKGSDMFISLHSNAAADPNVKRVVVYRAYDDLGGASVLALALGKAVADVMGVGAYQDATRTLETGVGEYYGVLRGARSVGCPLFFIIEHSFHTNEYATRFLLSDENLRKIAEAEVIYTYYGGDLVAEDEHYQIKGFKAGTTVGQALKILKYAGYDAAIHKDSRDILGTGDAIFIGGDMYTAVVLGDVNGDGEVNSADYVIIKRNLLGLTDLKGPYASAADMDDDGKISVFDYLHLKRRLLRDK